METIVYRIITELANSLPSALLDHLYLLMRGILIEALHLPRTTLAPYPTCKPLTQLLSLLPNACS